MIVQIHDKSGISTFSNIMCGIGFGGHIELCVLVDVTFRGCAITCTDNKGLQYHVIVKAFEWGCFVKFFAPLVIKDVT